MPATKINYQLNNDLRYCTSQSTLEIHYFPQSNRFLTSLINTYTISFINTNTILLSKTSYTFSFCLTILKRVNARGSNH